MTSESNMRNAQEVLGAIDEIRTANAANCLSSPFPYTDPETGLNVMGNLALHLGQFVGNAENLRVGFVDTQLPDLGRRAVLLAVIDERHGIQNTGYHGLFDVNPATGLHRLQNDNTPPQLVTPIDALGLKGLLGKADFSQQQPFLNVQARINSGDYPAQGLLMHALTDPRPLFS